MTRLEYLNKEVSKYALLSSLYTLGLLVQIIVSIFLIVHMVAYWSLHDYLTSIQMFKYSFSKFWFLYVYVIFMILGKRKLESFSFIYRSFKQQLETEERKESEAE